MQMSTTGLVVFILILVLAIYDLACVLFKGTGSSVSDFLIKAGIKAPMVTLGFGATVGHLFGAMYPEHCAPPSANILAPNFWMLAWATTAAAYFFLWRSTNSSDK